MGELLRELRKHLLIYRLFVKNSLIAQMEYRFNFIGNIIMESGYLLVKLSYVAVVYRSGVSINGLSPDEILLFVGTFVLLTGVYAGFFMLNNFYLRTLVRDGDLDLLLTKPISLQFFATLRRTDLGLFGIDFVAGAVMIAIAWARLAIPLNLATLGGFAIFLGVSAVIGYCLFLLPNILSFWFTDASAIASATDSFWDFNNMPMQLYSPAVQFVGVFLLPIFMVTNFPPMMALGKMPPAYLAWSAAAPLLLLGLVRLFWRQGLRSYSSASS